MKATGIVRRIDELGRVVIPKEIRKTLHIAEGTPLEIYTEKDALVLRRYSPVEGVEEDGRDLAAALYELTGGLCLITDTEKILCVSDAALKDYEGAPLTDAFRARLAERRSVLVNGETGEAAPVSRGLEKYVSQAVVPVLEDGAALGCAALLDENPSAFDGADVKLLQLGACFLARRFR